MCHVLYVLAEASLGIPHPLRLRLGLSEKCFPDNYTFGSLVQLASVLPRPPPTESWERFGGGGSAGPRLAASESIVIRKEFFAKRFIVCPQHKEHGCIHILSA